MAKVKLNENAMKAMKAPTSAAQAYFWDTEVQGFSVVVGKTGEDVHRAVKGTDARVKVKIGAYLAPRDDKHLWTVELARDKAKALLGQMATGSNPSAGRRRRRRARKGGRFPVEDVHSLRRTWESIANEEGDE